MAMKPKIALTLIGNTRIDLEAMQEIFWFEIRKYQFRNETFNFNFTLSAGEWDDEDCSKDLPFVCVKNKGRVFFKSGDC